MGKQARIRPDIRALLIFQTISFTFSLGAWGWTKNIFAESSTETRLAISTMYVRTVFSKVKLPTSSMVFLRHIHSVCEPLNSSIVLASGGFLNANMEIEYTTLVLYTNCQHLIKSLSTFAHLCREPKEEVDMVKFHYQGQDQRHSQNFDIYLEFRQYCFH